MQQQDKCAKFSKQLSGDFEFFLKSDWVCFINSLFSCDVNDLRLLPQTSFEGEYPPRLK